MSKYKHRGAYHYEAFKKPGDPYREHVLDIVNRVKNVVPAGGTIFEVGAGEGLILRKLTEEGFACRGCDPDLYAVNLARQKGNEVVMGSVFEFDHRCDAVLMLDVLEHVEDAKSVIEQAASLSDTIIIAIPDRHDPHAISDIDVDQVDEMVPDGWDCVDIDQRHARHVMVYQRRPEEEVVVEIETDTEEDAKEYPW